MLSDVDALARIRRFGRDDLSADGKLSSVVTDLVRFTRRLEADRRRLGVVIGIIGIRRFSILAHGRADHAGTTPMHMRKDAAPPSLPWRRALPRNFRASADRTPSGTSAQSRSGREPQTSCRARE